MLPVEALRLVDLSNQLRAGPAAERVTAPALPSSDRNVVHSCPVLAMVCMPPHLSGRLAPCLAAPPYRATVGIKPISPLQVVRIDRRGEASRRQGVISGPGRPMGLPLSL